MLTTIGSFVDADLVVYITDICVILLGFMYAMTVLKPDLVYDPPDGKYIKATAVLIVFYAFVSMFAVNAFMPLVYSQEYIAELTASNAVTPSFRLLFTNIVLAPITEELLYRRYLYGVLSEIGKKRAFVISTIFFALSHVTPLHICAAVFGGILFCAIYARTYQLKYSIAAHILFNLVATCIVYIPYPAFMYTVWWSITLLALFVAGLVYWVKIDPDVDFRKKHKELTEEQKRDREEIARIVDSVMAEHNSKD